MLSIRAPGTPACPANSGQRRTASWTWPRMWVGAVALHGGVAGTGDEVVDLEAIALAVQRHLVCAGPPSRRIVAVGDVERRCQRPVSRPIHQEGDVLDVIVLIARHDVERHAPELLFHRFLAEVQSLDHAERLFVGVRAGLVEVVVGYCAQRLQVDLVARCRPVEAPGHEVVPPSFAQDAAFGHGDTRGTRHQVIGVFDQSVPLRILKLAVAVARYPVKLQQPVRESVARGDLPGAHLVGNGIPGDDRLGSGTSGGRANAQDTLQRPLSPWRLEGSGECATAGQYLAGQLDERGHLHGRLLEAGAGSRCELQGPHAAHADMAQAFHRVEVVWAAALGRQPSVDDGVAEAIRE